MAEEEEKDLPLKAKRRKSVLVGFLAAMAFGGGGFYMTYSGMIGHSNTQESREDIQISELPPIEFLSVDPIVVSLGPKMNNRHLRFRANLEVEGRYSEEVELLKPRILDVMNSYLRAVDGQQFEEPAALLKLRVQLLRRIQLVTGEGRVRDLLIAEFVLN